jgi:hypothetical protein
MSNTARLVTGRIKAFAGTLPSGVRAMAGRTQERDLSNFLKVEPVGTQVLQWVVPGNEIEYKVITNKEWRLE